MSVIDYEIGIENVETKEYYHDVSFCAFFRIPLYKQASYCILKLNITTVMVREILDNINSNKHSKFNLFIYLIDRKNNDFRIKKIFQKNYLILNLKIEEKITGDKPQLNCRLLLVNYVLYYMNNHNTYNTILENTTAYDAINSYEGFIKTTYGDTFYKNHIGTKDNLNPYIYEQILIKMKNDLNVPTQLINTYKPFNSFNYYFFDDFNLTEECDKDISCTYLNLFNKDILTSFDVLEYDEILQGLYRIDENKLNDDIFELDKESESINYNHQELIYDNKTKPTQSSVPIHKTSNSENIELNVISSSIGEYKDDSSYDRKIKLTTNSALNTVDEKNIITQSSQSSIIYSPDSIDNSKLRCSNVKTFFIEKIENITSFECINSYPDWVQFGYIYNLEIDNSSAFLYTPLSIINIFQRHIYKENYLCHIVKFNCFKFFEEE